MYSSVQPGTQIGVHVSPLVIELRAIMKLKITATSTQQLSSFKTFSDVMLLTLSFDLVEFVCEYIDDI